MEDRNVLFVADEPEWCSTYLESLAEAFRTVIVKHDASQCLKYCEDHLDIDALIVDVMMPTPINVSSTETNSGLETGIYLIEQLRDYIMNYRCPIVVLTNRGRDLFMERFTTISLPKELWEIRQKGGTPSRGLPVLVKQLIDSNRS